MHHNLLLITFKVNFRTLKKLEEEHHLAQVGK